MDKEPRIHVWIKRKELPWVTCANCGIVKRRDGQNSPCKGQVKVGIRR